VAKGPDAFRTISEAADELTVPQHVLRFWETKFTFIKPMKRAGGRRFYRPQDIQVLHREQGIRRLIEAGEGVRPSVAPTTPPVAETATGHATRLRDTLQELESIKGRLDALLGR
jgi:DNA-binding transcriptional MerR regulator